MLGFAWFLGAGASRSSGLPTAQDLISDMKLRFYCSKENEKISRQDLQNPAISARIQDYMDSKGFPKLWSPEEYSGCFEKIFGENRDRQRRYMFSALSEDKIALTVGNRVLGAMLSSNLTRLIFTTNFDTVVEKSVAEMGGKSLSSYHLEGSQNANQAINHEEYPVYVKLHGDYRYTSLKNLSEDLLTQNQELSRALINGCNRFGLIVAGYSGRDRSVMALFEEVLESQNPFPMGIYWLGIKGFSISNVVQELLQKASDKGVEAHYIEIETYDSFMSRIWRNVRESPQNWMH